MNRNLLCGVTAAAMAVAAVTACSAPGPAKPGAATYYLALGDSLSRGVQPDAAGISVETGKGYPELVYAQLARDHRGLRLVWLGCPGETTMTMIHGGICRYPGGSQLAAAVTFLHAHRGHVLLVTIDIGANDPEACDSQPSLASLVRLASCVGQVPGAAARLGTILASLRAAARPRVRIVGMSYYLPELAECRTRRCDRARPPPRGPNQHANAAGYRVIAAAILRASGLGPRASPDRSAGSGGGGQLAAGRAVRRCQRADRLGCADHDG